MSQHFEQLLSGGHPNSLGNTIEVVETVLQDNNHFEEFFACYKSKDEVVRLRVSNGMKRICKENPDLVYSKIDQLLGEISQINQASTQWTLSQLFLELDKKLTLAQRNQAIKIMQRNLTHSTDWIVLIQTMQTLSKWAKTDTTLKTWLLPELQKLTKDIHKSVSTKAGKLYNKLSK